MDHNNTDSYFGKKMTIEEIFNTFVGRAVLGEPDCSAYPIVSLTIRYVGTPEEMANVLSKNRNNLVICHGKHTRNGDGVIWKSSFSLSELVGVWNTSVTADGGMSNEMLVLMSDGTGAFAEANMSPYWVTHITWYIENDILTIQTDDCSICHRPICYQLDVVVPCMSDKERHFTALMGAAYGLDYYRDTLALPLEEREAEAAAVLNFLRDEKKFIEENTKRQEDEHLI